MAKIDPKIVIGVGGLAALAFFIAGAAEAAEVTPPDEEPDLKPSDKEATKKSSSAGVSSSGGLRKGKSSPYNKPWQRCLCLYYAQTFGPDSIENPSTDWDTGKFGALTEARTKEFQRRSGITADGVVGKATNAAMDQWFAAQAGSFAKGQDARKSAEQTTCVAIRALYAAGQAAAKFFG